jgi:hypothetical protein
LLHQLGNAGRATQKTVLRVHMQKGEVGHEMGSYVLVSEWASYRGFQWSVISIQ